MASSARLRTRTRSRLRVNRRTDDIGNDRYRLHPTGSERRSDSSYGSDLPHLPFDLGLNTDLNNRRSEGYDDVGLQSVDPHLEASFRR